MTRPEARLGRGLAALFGESTPANPPNAVNAVAVEHLEPSPYQPRKSIQDAALQELAASIAHQGLLQPLLVRPNPARPGIYTIIAGERRWRAAKLAGLAEIPCFVRSMSDAESSAAALVENLQREDLNPIEEAEGFRSLVRDFSISHEDLGKAIGRSRSYVANQLRLLSLPEPVLELLRAGTLSAGHGRAALAAPHAAEAAALMVERNLSVRQAEALTSRPVLDTPRKAPSGSVDISRAADLHAVERDLMNKLGLIVSIRARGLGGQITVHYETLDQLDTVIARLGR